MGLNDVQKKERSEYLERYLEITECSQKKPYVFISYASDNWETVFKTVVVPMQKRYGLSVYADKAFDKVNDKWIVPMLRNIRGADVVVAFVSQSYIESYACFLELLTAVNNKKQIVFVSLEEYLHLGDTTAQPEVERGIKNEILNQGANIATNTNNTSNDLMRAMKSAYTSLSTLLEQDALSKYDISDAFINFFRDASINRKTINDLNAVRGTIRSVSERVFVESPITVQDPVDSVMDEPVPWREPAQVEESMRQPEPAQAEEAVRAEGWGREPQSVYPKPTQSEPARGNQAEFTWADRQPEKPDKKDSKSVRKKILIGAAVGAAAVVALFIAFVIFRGDTKNVTNQSDGKLSGTYADTTALLKYINEDMVELAEIETPMLESYNSVTGTNYTDDLTAYNEINETTIPLCQQLNEKVLSIIPEDKEIARVHGIYRSYASKYLNVLALFRVALEEQDSEKVIEVNERLSEVNDLAAQFAQELRTLAKERNVKLDY